MDLVYDHDSAGVYLELWSECRMENISELACKRIYFEIPYRRPLHEATPIKSSHRCGTSFGKAA